LSASSPYTSEARHRARVCVRGGADADEVALVDAARLEVVTEEAARVEDTVAEDAQPLETFSGDGMVKCLVEQER
jgi:hypothetical protein